MTQLVSICIPTFNGEAYIAEAMESAITQTYSNLEIIVSDDASSDKTLSIVETYKKKTSIPINVYSHEPKSIGSNWNYCVTKSNGEYIKFLFQDDILKPDCIDTMMTLAIKNPKVGLVYCKRELVFDKLTPNVKDFIDNYSHLHTYWDHFQVVQGVLTGKTYLRDRELLNSPKNKIGEPTNVLLKKDCFKKLGYFSEVLRQALDSDYWYRVMKYYDVGFIDLKLVKFRLHDNQTSVLNKNKNIQDKELLYRSYYKELFWFLHLQNQLKLLKLYHPIVKRLVKIKQSFNA